MIGSHKRSSNCDDRVIAFTACPPPPARSQVYSRGRVDGALMTAFTLASQGNVAQAEQVRRKMGSCEVCVRAAICLPAWLYCLGAGAE